MKPLALLVLSALVALQGCKRPKNKGNDRGPSEPRPSAASSQEEAPVVPTPCKLDDRIKTDVTVKRGCVVTVNNDILVEDGAALTLETGARLVFAASRTLRIDYGQLVAKGTDKEPVVFTSSNKSPAPGDWYGIVFEERTMAGTALDHVVVEYAGRKGGYTYGALSINQGNAPGRIAITNSIIRNNETAGVYNFGDQSAFQKFEGNTLQNNKVSLHLRAAFLGNVGVNKFGDPIHTQGTVASSQSWPQADVPFVLTERLAVKGEQSAAILTLPDKAVLRFAMGAGLYIGEGDGGGLVAKGVTFTSVNGTPAVGDWEGLVLFPKATQVQIDGCIIEYAGRTGGWATAAITFSSETKPTPNIKIANTTFRHNKEAAIDGFQNDCGEAGKPDSGNKSDGVPLCKKK